MFKSRLNNLSRRNTLFDHLFVDVDVLAVLVPAAQHPFLGRHPAVPEDVLQATRGGHSLVASLGVTRVREGGGGIRDKGESKVGCVWEGKEKTNCKKRVLRY